MKEQIRQIISEATDSLQARNLVREYLQARILQFLQDQGLFRTWVFHGGTALRFLYRIPRYSEDLDFTLKNVDHPMDLSSHISKVSRAFETEAYVVEVKSQDIKTVKSSLFRFPGLLNELGLSKRQTEKFSVKIEVDSRPPKGGTVETTIIRRYVILHLQHHDKATLFSGKLQAILGRPYTKGRDLYDLFWYLSDPTWPNPNLEYFNQGLKQTGWNGPKIDEKNWIHILKGKLDFIDWSKAIEDVKPFIERSEDLKMLTKPNVFKLLESRES